MPIAVTDLIPHRPPFLFVDEIVSEAPGTLTAKRTWRAEEDFYRGHYPNAPITPGVLLCEAAMLGVECGETLRLVLLLECLASVTFRQFLIGGLVRWRRFSVCGLPLREVGGVGVWRHERKPLAVRAQPVRHQREVRVENAARPRQYLRAAVRLER